MIIGKINSRKPLNIIIIFCIVSLVFGCTKKVEEKKQDYWPTNGWRYSTPEEQGVDSKKLSSMMKYILKERCDIDSITIIKNGYIVMDAYFYPFKKENLHPIFSCAKSITSAAFGIALDKGYIKNVDRRVYKMFPEKQFANLDKRKKAVTLKHLLTMTSAIKTEDDGAYKLKGLFGMYEQEDWVKFVLDSPMMREPGLYFEYSNCATFLLSAIIQKNTKMNTLDFIKENLFSYLGISDIRWVDNPEGIPIGFGGMWLKPHDMAKFGWLYINNGRWEDEQIISEKWVRESTQRYVDISVPEHPVGYGYQWWVKEGRYAAIGILGQVITVSPDNNMVVVVTCNLKDDADSLLPFKLMDTFVFPAAVSDSVLPENPEQVAYLNSLLKKAAESQPYLWKTEEEGVAEDGIFTRTKSPSFKLKYPVGCRINNLDEKLPDQIMSVRALEASTNISAYVMDAADNIGIEDFGPNIYLPRLIKYIPQATRISDLAIVSNKEITLNDNTKAYRIDIKFKHNNYKVSQLFMPPEENHFEENQVVVVAQRDNKYVFVVATAWSIVQNMEDLVEIAESLTFE